MPPRASALIARQLLYSFLSATFASWPLIACYASLLRFLLRYCFQLFLLYSAPRRRFFFFRVISAMPCLFSTLSAQLLPHLFAPPRHGAAASRLPLFRFAAGAAAFAAAAFDERRHAIAATGYYVISFFSARRLHEGLLYTDCQGQIEAGLLMIFSRLLLWLILAAR